MPVLFQCIYTIVILIYLFSLANANSNGQNNSLTLNVLIREIYPYIIRYDNELYEGIEIRLLTTIANKINADIVYFNAGADLYQMNSYPNIFDDK